MTQADFITKFSGAHYGDAKSLEQKFADLAAAVYGAQGGGVTVTDDATLTEADSGQTINVGTDAKTITLPLITTGNLGLKFRFRNTGADGGVALTISPASADGVNGSIANAAADSVAGGVVNKNLVNTKATANNMDWVELQAVALTKWAITGGVGIWASEA